MTTVPLDFASGASLGRVARVDTNRVLIEVSDHDALTRVTVSNLLAIQGRTANEYAIGVVDGVVRSVLEELFEDDSMAEPSLQEITRDQIRVVLVGTFWSRLGSKVNQFKRGSDTFPQIDRESYLIEGHDLQVFMSVLAEDLREDQRLQLGAFVADREAVAIADGNRLFQRHAALLGSTGAGKSWAVALILERASKLAHANLLVLDVHGEYVNWTSPALMDTSGLVFASRERMVFIDAENEACIPGGVPSRGGSDGAFGPVGAGRGRGAGRLAAVVAQLGQAGPG